MSPGRPCTRAIPAHQVQGCVDPEGLLQGAPSDLQEGDPAGGVPSVADLVAAMRDGLAEGRHDERRWQLRVVRGTQGSAGAADTQRRGSRRAGLGVRGAKRSRERVTQGRSPRLLAGPRMAARGGGARTTEAGRGGACALPRVGGLRTGKGSEHLHPLNGRSTQRSTTWSMMMDPAWVRLYSSALVLSKLGQNEQRVVEQKDLCLCWKMQALAPLSHGFT